MKSLAPALAFLFATCCAVAGDPAAALELSAPARSANPAVLALLQTAREDLRAGRTQQASTLLERALEIEPHNPTAWHYLARARLDVGNYAQAEAMAVKSHRLGGNDRALRVGNAELLSTALQSSGRTPTEAERQVLAAPSTFDLGVERASRYAATRDRRERDDAEPRRLPAPAQTATQSWRESQSPAWQRAQAAARQAEAAAQRAEAAARRAEAQSERRARATSRTRSSGDGGTSATSPLRAASRAR
jgi:tetratricopeptide (TPR) repeat protein